MATENNKSWVGTISIGHPEHGPLMRAGVRVVFRGVERESTWRSMLGFLRRCEATKCRVALTREDFFNSLPGDLSGFVGGGDTPDLNSAAIAEAASRDIL